MNVQLSPEIEELVDRKVRSGQYTSASEVVEEALRRMERQEEVLRHIDRGLAESARDEGVDGEEFMQRLIAELDDQIAKHPQG